MKIAFVGKGGSGKSSTSWLMVKTLESMGKRVLAIDADHNMDLTSLLGYDYESIPLMYRTEKDFSSVVGKKQNETWASILSNPNIENIKFTVYPEDPYTESIATTVSENLKLVTVGLGDPETLYAGKCAHGLSNPLKYYLGFLRENDSWTIIDSVAGIDMVNFGLFSGIDAMVCVVEPHINSVKVYKQIKEIARKTGLKLYIIINKPKDNELYRELKSENKETILGELPFDEAVINYEFEVLSPATKKVLEGIVTSLEKVTGADHFASLVAFHKEKTKFE